MRGVAGSHGRVAILTCLAVLTTDALPAWSHEQPWNDVSHGAQERQAYAAAPAGCGPSSACANPVATDPSAPQSDSAPTSTSSTASPPADSAVTTSNPQPTETAPAPPGSPSSTLQPSSDDNRLINIIGFGILAALFLFIFFLPSFIAHRRRLPEGTVIFVLNFLAPWTGVGWILLLAWALWPEGGPIPVQVSGHVSVSPVVADGLSVVPARRDTQHPKGSTKIEQLKKVAELRNSGVLTESEFANEKRRLLGS